MTKADHAKAISVMLLTRARGGLALHSAESFGVSMETFHATFNSVHPRGESQGQVNLFYTEQL
ncbi:MAG: hypothetical protein OJF51_000390 [Nitrospira sp.]|jgi:hypothetical protein|nr:MAG: hypothetical protein OJF51_000390 [Nitrospira sp.]